MSDLYLHGREVGTAFDLLGTKENSITYSLGWVLARCDVFARALLRQAFGEKQVGDDQAVHLQSAAKAKADHTAHGGFTDVELLTDRTHLIVEAKRGWNLPAQKQLERYVPRFATSRLRPALAVMAECSPAFAADRLPKVVGGIPVVYVSYKQVRDLTVRVRAQANPAGRRLLDDFRHYLEGIMTLQNVDSNLAYVVALGADTPVWCSKSWREIVNDHQRYFCPFGVKGWPKRPPNYMAFRYGGRLQRICHVDSYTVTKSGAEIAAEVPSINAACWDKQNRHADLAHFVFRLGPPIFPSKTVKSSGLYRSGKAWAALDLLLTADTIAEARDWTKARRAQP